jgi:hypothetical protein
MERVLEKAIKPGYGLTRCDCHASTSTRRSALVSGTDRQSLVAIISNRGWAGRSCVRLVESVGDWEWTNGDGDEFRQGGSRARTGRAERGERLRTEYRKVIFPGSGSGTVWPLTAVAHVGSRNISRQ